MPDLERVMKFLLFDLQYAVVEIQRQKTNSKLGIGYMFLLFCQLP